MLPVAAFLENDIGRFLLVHGGISPGKNIKEKKKKESRKFGFERGFFFRAS